MKKTNVKKLVLLAMLTAVAFLLVAVIRIPVVMFLNYEPKDVVIAIGGFLLGPMASLVISFMVSLLEMVTISSTGPIGAVMNFLSTCSFACTAAVIYKRKRTLVGAVAGLAAGSVVMVGVMLLWNYLITPLYMTGTSRSDVAAMLIPIFLPFNALKAGFNTALTLLLYKPLVSALRKAGLVPKASSGSAKWGIYLLGVALLATCILLLLVLRGII
jgi:riboflavin transporter FmnP